MKKNDVLLKPVEKDSLYLKISDAVYSYIKMNNLQPDDKLPSERDMAAMLQTSRNSVREGLRILEDRGLIYVKTGSGVFVKDPYGEHSAISVRLTECTTEELQELQTILDHQAVQMCIRDRDMANYFKIDPETEMIVIYDDIDLEPGQLRIRKQGSAGGHNGIKDLIRQLGTQKFVRIKVGVGAKPQGWDLADHVLGRFSTQERKLVDEAQERACKAVEMILSRGTDAAMNEFNKKTGVV